MKTKQERNLSTGLAVRTTLKAGEDYVPCGCASVQDAGWQCYDGKQNGNSKMVGSVQEISNWMKTYCPGADELRTKTPIKSEIDLS